MHFSFLFGCSKWEDFRKVYLANSVPNPGHPSGFQSIPSFLFETSGLTARKLLVCKNVCSNVCVYIYVHTYKDTWMMSCMCTCLHMMELNALMQFYFTNMSVWVYHMSTYMGNAIERCLQVHVSFSRCQICVLPHVFIQAQVSPIIFRWFSGTKRNHMRWFAALLA